MTLCGQHVTLDKQGVIVVKQQRISAENDIIRQMAPICSLIS